MGFNFLAHKVISKKPDFQHNLDTTVKQHYANQLYDCNSTSIAKTLLIQMPDVSFIQFCNELARVLGTHQHLSAEATTKSVLVSSVGVKSEEEGTVVKSQHKQDRENQCPILSDQRPTCTKLDSTIAKNSQIQEFLNSACNTNCSH